MDGTLDGSILYHNKSAYDAMMALYQERLSRLTVPYQERYVDTRFGRTFVLDAGVQDPAAPTIVFWHSLNMNATIWLNEINRFGQDFRVVAPDVVGDAGRSAPNRLRRRSMQHGRWAADVLTGLSIKRAHMVGLSAGGWMVFKLANVLPEAIQSATLFSSAGLARVNPAILLKMLPHLSVLLSTPKRAARRFLQIMSPPHHIPTRAELRTMVLVMQFKTERGIPRLPDAQVRALSAPTALYMAEHEAAFDPHAVLDRARRLLPNLTESMIVPGAGHGMNDTNPAFVWSKIEQMVERA